MIDEKKLIAEIREKIYPEKFGERCNSLDVIYAILQLIDEQTKVDEWIPCSEKLPEKYGDYLIAWYHKEKHIKALQNEHYYEICEYSPEEGWLSNFPQCPEGYEVVAWQPLPEPWEGE